MEIGRLRSATAARLVAVAAGDTIRTAALAFSDRNIGLLVVCDEGNRAVGVVSKSDLVRHLAGAGSILAPLAMVMSAEVVHCAPEDDLYHTWQTMAARGLQNMPVLGPGLRPLGILDVRDALAALFDQEQYQERLLIDYIAGVGYR